MDVSAVISAATTTTNSCFLFHFENHDVPLSLSTNISKPRETVTSSYLFPLCMNGHIEINVGGLILVSVIYTFTPGSSR